jgi:hypothetical protein
MSCQPISAGVPKLPTFKVAAAHVTTRKLPQKHERRDHDHQWRRCISFLKAVRRRGDSFNAKAWSGGATSRTRLHHSIAMGQSKPKTTLITPCHRVPPGSVWVRQNHQPTTTPNPV